MPNPYGQCKFINDASDEELFHALKLHKQLIKQKYGSGDGKDVSVSVVSVLNVVTNWRTSVGLR